MSKIQAHRYHDICAGHRVVGQGGKCEHLHGHNYRFHFTLQAEKSNSTGVDGVGRVLDFSDIKSKLCMWLEDNWDHKMVMWDKDPMALYVKDIDKATVLVPFNPTAENMAQYMADVIGPERLAETGTELVEVTIEETSKCHASYIKD